MPKKSSDIIKPRGPITAYALFVRTCRDELRRKHPQLTVDYNVIVKKCSERWKIMNENEKKRFNDTADIQRKKIEDFFRNAIHEQNYFKYFIKAYTFTNDFHHILNKH